MRVEAQDEGIWGQSSDLLWKTSNDLYSYF